VNRRQNTSTEGGKRGDFRERQTAEPVLQRHGDAGFEWRETALIAADAGSNV
jgi:hypothetical protein